MSFFILYSLSYEDCSSVRLLTFKLNFFDEIVIQNDSLNEMSTSSSCNTTNINDCDGFPYDIFNGSFPCNEEDASNSNQV